MTAYIKVKEPSCSFTDTMHLIKSLLLISASSALTFLVPNTGHTVFRSLDWEIDWTFNRGEETEYTLGYYTIDTGKWTVTHQILETYAYTKPLAGNLFPTTGQYKLGAWRMGHADVNVEPPYVSGIFEVLEHP